MGLGLHSLRLEPAASRRLNNDSVTGKLYFDQGPSPCHAGRGFVFIQMLYALRNRPRLGQRASPTAGLSVDVESSGVSLGDQLLLTADPFRVGLHDPGRMRPFLPRKTAQGCGCGSE